MSELDLAPDEQRAIRSLQRLGKRWPDRLLLFGRGGNSISVRVRPSDGSLYGPQWEVASVAGFPNDGGDGGDES